MGGQNAQISKHSAVCRMGWWISGPRLWQLKVRSVWVARMQGMQASKQADKQEETSKQADTQEETSKRRQARGDSQVAFPNKHADKHEQK